MNILITFAGRRVELVKEFLEKAKFLTESCEVFTTYPNSILSEACLVLDRLIKTPKVTDFFDRAFVQPFGLEACSEANH